MKKFSLEVTGKAAHELLELKNSIPYQTPVNIAFLGNENHKQRVEAAKLIRSYGLEPTPIVSSRRLQSEEDLNNFMEQMMLHAAPTRVMIVGGDPSQSKGPFKDSLALLHSNIIERHNIKTVVIPGYPEGHPKIPDDILQQTLEYKISFIRQHACRVEITTQLAFSSQKIIAWILMLRSKGIHEPIRIGVPSPVGAGKLLSFAKQFGLKASSSILKKYGMMMANVLQPAKVDLLYEELLAGIKQHHIQNVHFHLYTFGGFGPAREWLNGKFV